MAIRRREFLAGLAAAGGASLLPSTARTQQRAARELAIQPPPKFKYTKTVIDAHVHRYPPEMASLIEQREAETILGDAPARLLRIQT